MTYVAIGGLLLFTLLAWLVINTFKRPPAPRAPAPRPPAEAKAPREILRDVATPDPAQVRTMPPPTGALARSAEEVRERRARRGAEPATSRQAEYVERLGFDPEGLTFAQAGTLLSIHTYVMTLADRTPEDETPEQLLRVIERIRDRHPHLHEPIDIWSWHTRDQIVRRIPRDAVRHEVSVLMGLER